MTNDQESPEKCAIRLSKLLKQYSSIHNEPRFPINISELAKEYSKQTHPDEAITLILGENLSKGFDGMLSRNHKNQKTWSIFYNSTSNRGRVNFTIAHEFGHYLLHRNSTPTGFKCDSQNMLDQQSKKQETEANIFASYLLMPLDDFRKQLKNREISLDCIDHLTNRYQVSKTAALLKWANQTKKRAMILLSKDGFIDWAWSNEPLIKSGIYYSAKQKTTPLPESSCSYNLITQDNKIHSPGIWIGNEEVREISISQKTESTTITLLIYPNLGYSEEENDDVDEQCEEPHF